jgi:hypothetical protein
MVIYSGRGQDLNDIQTCQNRGQQAIAHDGSPGLGCWQSCVGWISLKTRGTTHFAGEPLRCAYVRISANIDFDKKSVSLADVAFYPAPSANAAF